MSDSTLQQGRNTARAHNQDLLLNIGFLRLGSSNLFSNANGKYILSPGISAGIHQKYWFDVRDANLRKIGTSAKAWVFLRIVPNSFALFSIERIQGHFNKKTQDDRPNSGLVYGFHCVLDEPNRQITVIAKNDPSAKFVAELLNRVEAQSILASELRI